MNHGGDRPRIPCSPVSATMASDPVLEHSAYHIVYMYIHPSTYSSYICIHPPLFQRMVARVTYSDSFASALVTTVAPANSLQHSNSQRLSPSQRQGPPTAAPQRATSAPPGQRWRPTGGARTERQPGEEGGPGLSISALRCPLMIFFF